MPVHLFLCLYAFQKNTEVTAPPKSPPRLVIGPTALQCHIVADGVIVDYNAKDIFWCRYDCSGWHGTLPGTWLIHVAITKFPIMGMHPMPLTRRLG